MQHVRVVDLGVMLAARMIDAGYRRVRRAVGGGGAAAHQDRAALPLLQGRRAGGVVRNQGQGEDHRRHPEVYLGRART